MCTRLRLAVAASVSKQFTAATVVLLARAGKLSLDDPVRKYVPELPDFGAPLTIRHLLHTPAACGTGGICLRLPVAGDYSRPYPRSRSRRPEPPGNAQLPFRYAWSYTKSGYNVAAIFARDASGHVISMSINQGPSRSLRRRLHTGIRGAAVHAEAGWTTLPVKFVINT